MSKSFYILILFFCSYTVLAQESVVLEGQILADSLNGSSINIVNFTKETGTISDLKGNFELEVTEGDTLLFSSVQYEPREIMVTEEVLKHGFLTVLLLEKVNELEEVNISNISLSGDLEEDISGIEFFDQSAIGFPYSTRSKRTPIEREIYSAGSSPVSLLIYTLNGKMKKLKRAKANQDLDILVHKGMNSIPLPVFVDDFKIPEAQVINFVYFCAEDPVFKDLVNQERPLELIEFYRGKVSFFLKNRMSR